MAGTHCVTFSSLIPTDQLISIRTKPLFASISASSVPPKPIKRKNYLRPKILKSLTEPNPFSIAPFLQQQSPTSPIVPIVSPDTLVPYNRESELPSDHAPAESCSAIIGEGDAGEEFLVSETPDTTIQYSGTGIVGNFSSRTILRYGVYLIGAFVFQTIFAVWVLGNGNSRKKDTESKGLVSGNNRASQTDLLLNGNDNLLLGSFNSKSSKLLYLDDLVTKEKIEEIRSMARAARETERKQASKDVGDSDTEDGSTMSRARIGIEKEVDARMIKLQKRLSTNREKLPDSYINHLSKSGKVDDGVNRDGSDANEGKGTLTFKKKLKFRSPSTELKKSPKGFRGPEKDGTSRRKTAGSKGTRSRTLDRGNVLNGGSKSSDQEKQVDEDLIESFSRSLKEDDGKNLIIQEPLSSRNDVKKLNAGTEQENTEQSNGVLQEAPSVEVKSQISGELQTHNPQNFVKENKNRPALSDKPPMLTLSGSSAGNKSVALNVKEKQTTTDTGYWWLNLPYVLVIFMLRGSDREGQGGLYTLKTPSQAHDEKDASYTVAFEDRTDANNFCYLLESFFEDLGDFSADIVPLTRKELHEAVNTGTRKLIVVRKGQLQLYAGQPFADVEMALHALVEQNQC